MFNMWKEGTQPEADEEFDKVTKKGEPDRKNFDEITWKHASHANSYGWPVFSLDQFEALLKEKNAQPSSKSKASIEEISDEEQKIEKPSKTPGIKK